MKSIRKFGLDAEHVKPSIIEIFLHEVIKKEKNKKKVKKCAKREKCGLKMPEIYAPYMGGSRLVFWPWKIAMTILTVGEVCVSTYYMLSSY